MDLASDPDDIQITCRGLEESCQVRKPAACGLNLAVRADLTGICGLLVTVQLENLPNMIAWLATKNFAG